MTLRSSIDSLDPNFHPGPFVSDIVLQATVSLDTRKYGNEPEYLISVNKALSINSDLIIDGNIKGSSIMGTTGDFNNNVSTNSLSVWENLYVDKAFSAWWEADFGEKVNFYYYTYFDESIRYTGDNTKVGTSGSVAYFAPANENYNRLLMPANNSSKRYKHDIQDISL